MTGTETVRPAHSFDSIPVPWLPVAWRRDDFRVAMIKIVKTRAVPGYLPGMRQPALAVDLTHAPGGDGDWAALDAGVCAILPGYEPPPTEPPPTEPPSAAGRPLAARILHIARTLLRGAGFPVFGNGMVLAGAGPEASRLIVPAVHGRQAAQRMAVEWAVAMVNQLLSGRRADDLSATHDRVRARLAAAAPQGSNPLRFLAAAGELNIPWRHLAGNVFQFGQGARARWLDSSFTDATGSIAAKFARDKQMTATLLRQAGIPAPVHRIAANAEQAVALAERLGYPVVVKPAALDGGLGVAAGLDTAEEVREAFAAARKHAPHILVEKHFQGRDYRMIVFRDELIWAVERVPGGVTGDGRSTVRELLATLNADPRRGEGPHAPLKRLAFDAEAAKQLRKAGLGPDSVPAEGEFIRLRSVSNLASGGMPVAVFDAVHPDNRVLAIRTAAALRLDLAGVDLLIPDIRRSWLETGAVVCEVNAQPTLGGQITTAQLYTSILNGLLGGDGRIPVVVCVGGGAGEYDPLAEIAASLAGAGLTVGRADPAGVSIGEVRVANGPSGSHDGALVLLLDRRVEAVLLRIDDASILSTGLPVDRFDVLVLAGTGRDGPVSPVQSGAAGDALLAALAQACRGRILALPGAAVDGRVAAVLGRLDRVCEPVEPGRLGATVARHVLGS